jgi:putative ABC transport system permease protein
VALSALGGLAGAVIGLAVVIVYARYQAWPLVIPTTAIAAGAMASITIGAPAGLYPAIRASHLSPTEALTTT